MEELRFMEQINDNISILILSCDRNVDLFYPFYYCTEKYWPDHPKIYYSTETVANPYYQTLMFNYPLQEWGKRILKCVEEINTPYILSMVDDVFIRQTVNNTLIQSLPFYFNENTAALNFEFQFDINDTPLKDFILRRNPNGRYKNSTLCQLWEKEKFKSILSYNNGNVDPWKIEDVDYDLGFDYLITTHGILDFGKYRGDNWRNWGVFHGQWAPSTVAFFQREGLNIDFSKRGISNLIGISVPY